MREYLRRSKRFVLSILSTKKQQKPTTLLEQRILLNNHVPKVRIAVAGAGKFAQTHLEVLSALPNVELVGVSNRGNSDITPLAQQYEVAKTFADYRTMLDTTHPDGVFVVVSHFQTVRVATDCLIRGIPCLIEKPAGFTSAETKELAKVADENNCLNMVGVNRRFVSVIHEALTRVLQRGVLKGIVIEAPEAIRRIRTIGRHDPRLYDLWLLANNIHAIDLFRCLGGEVEDIYGFKNCREERNGDSFSTIMRLSNDCLGTYISHWNSAGTWVLKLYGEGILAKVSLSKYAGEIYLDKSRFPITVDPIDRKYKAGVYVQDQTFINALALGEKLAYPASDLNDAVKTMQLIEQILDSK